MTDLITEARELCELRRKQKYIPMSMLDKMLELCDALEKAQEQNKQLMHEVCKLACESVERDVALAKLEAEVAAAVGEGCEYCLSTWPDRAADGFSDIWHGNKLSVGYGVYREIGYCPMCGRRLEERHEVD